MDKDIPVNVEAGEPSLCFTLDLEVSGCSRYRRRKLISG